MLDNNTQKKSVLIIATLIVVIIMSVAIYFFKKNSEIENIVKEVQSTGVVSDGKNFVTPVRIGVGSEYVFYSVIEKEIGRISGVYKVEETKEHILDWVSVDGLRILDDNSAGLYFYISSKKESLQIEVAQMVAQKIDQIMTERGFKINQKNLFESVSGFSTRAYESKSVIAKFMPIDGDTFYFGFSDKFNSNYQQQAKYLNDIKELRGSGSGVVEIKRVGDFARLYVYNGFPAGSHDIIVQLVDGIWKKIIGSDPPGGCQVFYDYHVPKELILCTIPDGRG